MKRSRPAQRRTWPKRSTKRIRQRKKDPARRAWAKHRCDPFREWLKTLPCCMCGKRTGEYLRQSEAYGTYRVECVIVDPAHLIPRGRGSDDLYNCVPLARHLHESQEKRTDAFNAEHGVDLWALAAQYADEWLATDEGIRWQQEHGEGAAQ